MTPSAPLFIMYHSDPSMAMTWAPGGLHHIEVTRTIRHPAAPHASASQNDQEPCHQAPLCRIRLLIKERPATAP